MICELRDPGGAGSALFGGSLRQLPSLPGGAHAGAVGERSDDAPLGQVSSVDTIR